MASLSVQSSIVCVHGDALVCLADRQCLFDCDRYFNVSENAFQGAIPVLSTELVSLDISVNKFTGTLPSDMSAYTNLVDIQASYNSIEGSLPSKMPPHLVQLAVAGNKLTGPMPALPRGIKYVSVTENGLEGSLPDGPGASSIWFVSTGLC